MFKKKVASQEGFLLVEVLVSLVILAIVGLVIINSLSSQSLQSSKNSVKSESSTRLSSASDVIASAPFSPCTSQSPNQNPYSSYAASISPVTIVAIYGITSTNDLAYCLQSPDLLTAKLDMGLVNTPWPVSESGTARVQKIVLFDPATKLTRSVVKTFDSKATSYGLGGAFRTVIRSVTDNSQITNVIIEVGKTQTFKLDVLPARPETETIRYLITQGSSGPNSNPAVNASISGNLLTVSVPEKLSDGTSNSSGRAKIDVEGFDVDAALLAYPAGIGITVKVPPPSGLSLLSQKILISGTSDSFQPVKASGIAAPFTYAISPALPSGLSLNTDTGVISGTPVSTLVSTSYSITVQDKSGQTSDPVAFTLRIISPIVATFGALTDKTFNMGSAITAFTPLTLSGGNSPYTYSISPTLPSGLTLNSSTGLISGTPTSPYSKGSFRISGIDNSITGYDGQGASDTFNLEVIVTPLTSTLGATNGKTLYTGSAITAFTPLALSGGNSPYTYTISPALPSGLTLNTSTGVISGTPSSVLAQTDFTVTGSDSSATGYTGKSLTTTFAMRVLNPLSVSSTSISLTFTKGVNSTKSTVTASGGLSPYVFSITSGTLPTGLSLNSSTGEISGNAASKTTKAISLTLTVKDSLTPTAQSINVSISLSVN